MTTANANDQRTELEKQLQEAIRDGDAFKQQYLESQLADLQQDEPQEEEWTPPHAEVTEIELPLNYDDIYGKGCNEEMKSLISEALKKASEINAANISDLRGFYTGKLDVLKAANSELADRSSQQQIKISDLERDLNEAGELVAKATREKSDLEHEKNDALDKRDNAVQAMEVAQAERDKYKRDVESLRGQIDELERILSAQKRSEGTGSKISLIVSKATAETVEERKERLLRMKMDTINRNLKERFGLDPLPTTFGTKPAEEEVVTDEQLEEAREEAFPSSMEQQQGDSVPRASEPLETAAEPSLIQRVEELESWRERVSEILHERLGESV